MANEMVARHPPSAPGGLTATRITAQEVLARRSRGEPIVFLDARREEEWRSSSEKLPGALRLPPERPDETLPLIPAGRSVIVYCTCPNEASSARVAERLLARGVRDVHPLYGGLAAWRLAGGRLEPM
jgi:rhodanese-related sulfurtransferase